MLDAAGELRGVVVESIAADIGKDKLLALMDTVRNLEIRANYYDQKGANKSGLATFENIIGESRAVENMRIRGRRFALSSEPILLTGESGTGKEVVAQALHMAGLRADKPFVTVNCAALPQELMEAEMFGYASGAFTGAKTGGIKGKFEMADTGTILLDEIGEIPLPLQAKFLRVLESGEIQKLAHTGSPIVSDFRVIAATNRDLADMVEQGRFREDLYHRLNIFELHIPPLRERTEDIPLLTKHFITRSVGDRRAKNIRVDGELYRVFARYPWRGNIRELKNVLTYALYTLGDKGDTLGVRHLPKRFLQELGVEATTAPAREPIDIPMPIPPCIIGTLNLSSDFLIFGDQLFKYLPDRAYLFDHRCDLTCHKGTVCYISVKHRPPERAQSEFFQLHPVRTFLFKSQILSRHRVFEYPDRRADRAAGHCSIVILSFDYDGFVIVMYRTFRTRQKDRSHLDTGCSEDFGRRHLAATQIGRASCRERV